MKNFISNVINDYSFLSFVPWWSSGIVHGFCQSNKDFKGGFDNLEIQNFKLALNLSAVLIPKQNHTDKVIELNFTEISLVPKLYSDIRNSEADAVVVYNVPNASCARVALGVLTADCMPLIMKTNEVYAAVHSGWRGLANGIITKTLACLRKRADLNDLEVLIGPCAGEESYEVGREVVDGIGGSVVFKELGGDKYLLNLAATATAQILNFAPQAKIFSAGICTIQNRDFHSYRRDKDSSGRSLSFVVI